MAGGRKRFEAEWVEWNRWSGMVGVEWVEWNGWSGSDGVVFKLRFDKKNKKATYLQGKEYWEPAHHARALDIHCQWVCAQLDPWI